jgi:pyruvate formate lyase activating enzyme
MKIGGLQPVTLLDYPQKVAAIIFASGCNMRCPFCYNPKLVLPELIEKETLMPEEEIFDFLNRRKNYLDGIVFTGGEPLLQVDALEFIKKVKDLGYLIKLDTNGLKPDVLAEALSLKLVDYLAMDIKGPLGNYDKYCGVMADPAKIRMSVDLVMKSGLPYEFRSTLAKGLHSQEDVVKMAEIIEGADKYYLQNFNFHEVLVGTEFVGQSFTSLEMSQMRDSVAPYVKYCAVR